jgi:hypothetical protein
MSYLSYYYQIDKFIKNPKEKELQNISSISNNLSKSQYKLLMEIREQKLSLQYLFQKVKEDMPKLEKFIIDSKYREKLLNLPYYSQERYELFDIFGLEKIVKEKIGVPENAAIKFEKVKCSKKCNHNHQYFYAYYWNSTTKKLRKKYIGKQLPEPFKFKITYSLE